MSTKTFFGLDKVLKEDRMNPAIAESIARMGMKNGPGMSFVKLDHVLSEKVSTAIDADEKYVMVNDAKMRAVKQVVDYDGFRGMVLGGKY